MTHTGKSSRFSGLDSGLPLIFAVVLRAKVILCFGKAVAKWQNVGLGYSNFFVTIILQS